MELWRVCVNVGGSGGFRRGLSLSVTGSRCCRSFKAADRAAERHSGAVLVVDKPAEDNVSS